MNTQELISRYIQYRDHLAAEQEKFDLIQKPYKDAMEVLAGAMLQQLNTSGEESVRTDAGTAYKSTTMHARVTDREALFNFVRESDEFDLLVAGVAKDAVKVYSEEHQGALPPGVEVTFITRCNFRRS
jgi:hypothetical protein